jgi:hypothetical protein
MVALSCIFSHGIASTSQKGVGLNVKSSTERRLESVGNNPSNASEPEDRGREACGIVWRSRVHLTEFILLRDCGRQRQLEGWLVEVGRQRQLDGWLLEDGRERMLYLCPRQLEGRSLCRHINAVEGGGS